MPSTFRSALWLNVSNMLSCTYVRVGMWRPYMRIGITGSCEEITAIAQVTSHNHPSPSAPGSMLSWYRATIESVRNKVPFLFCPCCLAATPSNIEDGGAGVVAVFFARPGTRTNMFCLIIDHSQASATAAHSFRPRRCSYTSLRAHMAPHLSPVGQGRL